MGDNREIFARREPIPAKYQEGGMGQENDKKRSRQEVKKLVEVYKRYLVMTDDTQPGKVRQWTRDSAVQYLCSFSKPDPDEIAAALTREGTEAILTIAVLLSSR